MGLCKPIPIWLSLINPLSPFLRSITRKHRTTDQGHRNYEPVGREPTGHHPSHFCSEADFAVIQKGIDEYAESVMENLFHIVVILEWKVWIGKGRKRGSMGYEAWYDEFFAGKGIEGMVQRWLLCETLIWIRWIDVFGIHLCRRYPGCPDCPVMGNPSTRVAQKWALALGFRVSGYCPLTSPHDAK